jgi:hypothetical protein
MQDVFAYRRLRTTAVEHYYNLDLVHRAGLALLVLTRNLGDAVFESLSVRSVKCRGPPLCRSFHVRISLGNWHWTAYIASQQAPTVS